jgi:putative nucleotidyltransferase with HDIG domain
LAFLGALGGERFEKKITIDNLQVGMYMEADVRDSSKGKGATPGSKNKVPLAGSGMLITSENQIRRLNEAGLNEVTIDSSKGKDTAGGTPVAAPAPVVMPREPRKKPLPEGRTVEYKDELQKARATKTVVKNQLKEALDSAAIGGAMDHKKLDAGAKLITESVFRNVDAMVGLTRLKEHDPYTANHCINVCIITLAVAHADGIDQNTAEMLATATLLHDIGKTKIPLEILNKPGKFEPHEFDEMRKHTTYGRDVLYEMPGVTEEMMLIATQHHEMLNGKDYPDNLTGEKIHRFGQMTAIADVYDALTSARVYKPALPPHFALGRIYQNKDIEFNGDLVDLFVKALGLYPVGSLVLLNTTEVGIVTEPNPGNVRQPKVGVFITRYKKQRTVPVVFDLSDPNATEERKIMKVLDPTKYKIDVDKMLKMVTG